MYQPALEKKLAVHASVTDKHTEASHPRRSTRSNLGQIFPTYAQAYTLVTTVPRYIMDINTRIFIRTEIYSKSEMSDTDTMYFNQATNENDDTQFLKSEHKEFSDLISKGMFEMIPCTIFP